MLKKLPRLLLLETLFLGITFVFVVQDFSVIHSGINLLGFDLNILWGSGSQASILSTSVIGYVFAVLYQKSLREKGAEAKGSKVSYFLAIAGILAFSYEALRLSIDIPLQINLQLGLIILVVDYLRYFKKK